MLSLLAGFTATSMTVRLALILVELVERLGDVTGIAGLGNHMGTSGIMVDNRITKEGSSLLHYLISIERSGRTSSPVTIASAVSVSTKATCRCHCGD